MPRLNSRHFRTLFTIASLSIPFALTSVGCSNPLTKLMFVNHKNRNPAMSSQKQYDRSEEITHRSRYQATRSSADLEWLMKNRIENGLTVDSVNNILGQKGKALDAENQVSQASASSGSKDGTYEYGPDDQGRTYHLTFRNSRLVEYTPSDSLATGPSIAQASHRTSDGPGRASLDDKTTSKQKPLNLSALKKSEDKTAEKSP